ncbi:hypothetical protein ACE1OC_37155 [Streptomyces sp. DSM 116496]|uniref:hypothetical protein n=1 Tax=Streptomyces stoeckheimensis TaxID=3344656 RepID=UPI0038B25D2C
MSAIWLRLETPAARDTSVAAPAPAPAPVETSLVKRWKLDEFGNELLITSKRLALYFLGFATLGFPISNTIPTRYLTGYLGGSNWYSVPLAALIGILFTEAVVLGCTAPMWL